MDSENATLAQTQIDLLNKGFHLVEATPSDTSENVPRQRDAVYRLITKTHGVSAEVALTGSGAEAVELVKWAVTNREKTSALVFENGVFSFAETLSPQTLAASRLPIHYVGSDDQTSEPSAPDMELLQKA